MSQDPTRHALRDNAMAVEAMSSRRIESDANAWTRRLVLFLRIMAVLSVIKGLYHWAQVTGFIGGEEDAFENQPMAWQTATVYFAVIELVAAVGLWLATPWGAVVWLTTVVSMAVIELMFPGIYGGSLTGGGVEAGMLAADLGLRLWGAGRPPPPPAIGARFSLCPLAGEVNFTPVPIPLEALTRPRARSATRSRKIFRKFAGNPSLTVKGSLIPVTQAFRIRTNLFPNATPRANEA